MNRSSRSSTARVAVAVIALLALGACGDDETPDPAVRSEAGSRPGTAPLDEPSETPTLPESDPPTSEPTSEPAAPETTSTAPPEPELVVYARDGVGAPVVTSNLDVGRLRGAPADFKEFIGRLADKNLEESTCTDGGVSITVDVVRSDGFAVGGVHDCGGYKALWAKDQGDWLLVQATQESWDCALLELYRVPNDVLLNGDTCYDSRDEKEHTYQQA